MEKYRVMIDENSRYQIELETLCCGTDYCVAICGGTRYHVGAVAFGCAKMGNGCLPGHQATVSVICSNGHRDDEIARWAARYLATALNCSVSVSAGVHIDNAIPDEIDVLMGNCKAACEAFVQQISEEKRGYF